jgi:hypothetical protein
MTGSEYGYSGLAMHTLNSLRFRGPLHILSGRVFRAGKVSLATWKFDTLVTHGQDGATPIGRRIHVTELLEVADDIGYSFGSPPGERVSFDDQEFRP